MISFPNAKINLGLNIIGRRPDGYHLLETLFYPIPLCDVLEAHPLPEGQEDRLTLYGADNLGDPADNLVLRAVRALRARYAVPPLDIYLRKHIPSGAGMGGGSADASFMLTMLNRELALGVTQEELREIALGLGADCPVFIDNVPAFGEGIGEQLTPYEGLSLSGYVLVVVKPELHISTAEAFRGLRRVAPAPEPLRELLDLPLEQWHSRVVNDFEESLFPLHPELEKIKTWLYDQGAIYASMTGSGAALYGIFAEEIELDRYELKDYFVWQHKLP